MTRIQRYLMVTCQVCSGIKCVDRGCKYCGAVGPIAGEYYNRKGVMMRRASGNSLAAKIAHVAAKLGMTA